MLRFTLRRALISSAARTALLGLLCLAALPQARAQGGEDPAGDDRIRQRIEARLLGQVGLRPEGLVIDVSSGVARISGTVASLGQRQRLVRLVSGVVGVTRVEDELAIRSGGRSEQDLRQEAERMLLRRTRFRARPIEVSVQGSEVTLAGRVERALDRLDAEEICADVDGVTRVINLLEVASGGGVSPETIHSRVTSILTNPLTFGVVRSLTVSVDQGVVTLGGQVTRQADRLEAERLALSVPGVTAVVNGITVPGS